MLYAELTASQFVKNDELKSSESTVIHLPERGMQIFVVEGEGAPRQTGSTQIKRIIWHRVDQMYFEIEYFDSNRKNSVHSVDEEMTFDVYQLKRVHLGVQT